MLDRLTLALDSTGISRIETLETEALVIGDSERLDELAELGHGVRIMIDSRGMLKSARFTLPR